MSPPGRQCWAPLDAIHPPDRQGYVGPCDQLAAHAQDVLLDSAGFSRFLFELIPQPLWLFDVKTLRLLAVNPAAIQVCGYSEAQFLSMTLRSLYAWDETSRLEDHMRHNREGRVSAGRWRLETSDGRFIEAEMTWYSVVSRGKSLGLSIMTDIGSLSCRNRGRGALGPLGCREEQVVRLLAKGCRSKRIALDMGISVRTVETHRKAILRKLGLHTTAEVIRVAIRMGIVEA